MTAWAAAAAVGIGTGLGSGRGWLAGAMSAACVAGVVAALMLRPRKGAATIAALVALAAGAGGSAAWRSSGAERALLPDLAAREAVVDVCGTVRLRRPRSIEILADEVVASRTRWRTREPLRISGRDATSVSVGRRVCGRGPLVAPRPHRSEAPLLVARTLRVASGGSVIRRVAGDVRRSFSAAAQRALPRTQAGLLLGMTDGDIELMDERTTEMFRTTGLAHLVAVSGSNVAVVLVIVMLVARWLIPRGRWLRAAAAAPPLVFFAFLTGLEASVLRAVFTAGVALAVTSGGRTADALRVSAFAFVVLVLVAPDMLFHPGFQLSFGATLGLILWAGPLTDRLSRVFGSAQFARGVAVAIATTVSAQAAVAPLLAWHFGRLPALGGIANLVVAPLAPVVMIGGSVTLGLASMTAALDWAPAMMRLPLDVILLTARWFSSVPAASVGAGILAGVGVAGALAAFLSSDRRIRIGLVALVVVASATAAGQARARASFACDGAAVHALDVGQGSAVVVEAEGSAVLVDAGPAGGGVVGQLDAIGVRRLDALVVTHPHVDHALGALDVLRELDVDRVLGPVTMSWRSGRQVLGAAKAARVGFATTALGDGYTFGPLRMDVLWPEPGPAPFFDEDLVDPFSLVVRVRVGDVVIVLPGDIRVEQQRELVSSGIGAAILIAPHHGSKNLDASFVDDVSPSLTLITVGAQNPYGLPAPEAVRAYARHGRVFRTDQDGRVSVCVHHDGMEVVTSG